MKPTLVPGDLVFASSLFRSLITINSLVVLFDDYSEFIIKRVSFKNSRHLILKNDNLQTVSRFCKKPININQVKYIVWFKLNINYLRRIKPFSIL